MKFLISIITAVFVGGIIGYFVIPQSSNNTHNTDDAVDEGGCQYTYINPNRCEPEERHQKREYITLRNNLVLYIDQEKQKGNAKEVSVYFRDLQNGPIVNISGDKSFAPASLLKVPLMISFLKKAEEDPALLRKTLRLVADIPAVPQNIVPKETIQKEKEYPIDDIIRIMVTHSDNVSWELLLLYLKREYSEDDFVLTLSDLGIIDPSKRSVEQVIPVQTYASLFRILYNSSYLTPEMSNKALSLLSQSSFTDGLVAGVPSDVRVAHKFGEVRYGSEQQLHDCGVVYFTQNPYLLCIMTKGDDIKELSPIIQTISKHVYEAVSGRHPDEE